MNTSTVPARTPKQKRFSVSAAAVVNAPAARIYRMIADYRQGHPRIVPPRYFRNLRVVEGGYGNGTLIEFDMIAFGSTQHARARVTEPEPGRVLVETDLDRGYVTTFTVTPLAEGARVTISTELSVRSGILGVLQRRIFSAYLTRVFREELEQLTKVMGEKRQVSS
jgi:hypothetical protein